MTALQKGCTQSRQERKEQQIRSESSAPTNEVAILVAEIQYQG
jgi:hypothetical protein